MRTTGRLTPASNLHVHSEVTTLTQTQFPNYANFNNFVVTGRIHHAEIAEKNGSQFLAVTLITTCLNDDEGVSVTFNNSNGIMSLFERGFLPTGRQLTISGHIAYVRETYIDKQTGEVTMLKRPNIHLVDASIPTGGLGALPADKSEKTVRKVGVVRPAQATAKSQEPELDTAPAF